MMGTHRTLIAIALLIGLAAPAAAQDTVAVGVRAPLQPGAELPREVAERLVAYYNSPATIRFSGRTRIPAGRTISGDVAILGGPVELDGVLNGDLVVLNGDVTLGPDSHVAGDLTVVGGVVVGADVGRVDGVITTYTAVFRYRRTDEGIAYAGSAPPAATRPVPRRLGLPRWTLGESEIFVSARPYNRIEALPIAVGPRITTGGRNPLRAEALLIYRTEAGFDPGEDDAGYQVRLRQYVGGHHDLWLGAGAQSIIDPIETWKLTNLENSLVLFLFRREYRDYYERQGWYTRIGWRPNRAFSGSLEFREEDHRPVSARTPWTILFNTEDGYPVNAAAERGELHSLLLTLGLDTRNDPDEPWSGWFARFSLERAVGGRLAGIEPDFTHFFLDLRRFNRVSRTSVVALRLVGGGRAAGSELPAQREHVIGGAGSLPGYDETEFDCGARGSPLFGSSPGYGCQRFALFQAEYRSALDFHWRWDERQDIGDIRGDILSIDLNPALLLFYDAGAAWDTDESYWDHLTKSDNWVADLGAGLDFGGLGFYFAYPLVGSGGFNFVTRLTARF